MDWNGCIGIASFGPMAMVWRRLFKQSSEDFKTAEDQMIVAIVIRSGLLKPNHANGLRL
jgi:hypothetical protein